MALTRPGRWAAALLCIGLALRLFHLGHASLWLDEAYETWIAQQPLAQQVAISRLFDFHPPLFHFLLDGFMHVWHALGQGESEAEVRTPSMVFGVLAVWAAWRGGRDLLGDQAGLFATALLAVSAFAIPFDQEARGYALLNLLTILSAWQFWRVLTVPARGTIAWYLLATGLAEYIDMRTLLVLAGQGLWLLLCWRRRPAGWRQGWIAWAVAVAVALPWVPTIVYQLGPQGLGIDLARTFVPPRAIDVILCPAYLLAGYTGGWSAWVGICIGLAATALVLLGARRGGPAGAYLGVLVGLVVAGPIAGWYLIHFHGFYFKYCMQVEGLFLLLVGCALSSLPRRALPALAACLLLGLPSLQHWYFEPQYEKQRWREAMAFVRDRLEPGDAVYISAPFMAFPARYYFGAEPPIHELVPWKLDSDAPAMLAAPRFWLILSNDAALDPTFKIRKWAAGLQMSRHLDATVVDFPNAFDPRTGGAITVILVPLNSKQ
ncbi:MAG TPA: glycosyltransferase family 39 protein [Candidatus Xenobia bacterium]|jgi:hypothetical protein